MKIHNILRTALFGLIFILILAAVSAACADLTVTTDGDIELDDDEGLIVKCNTMDELSLGMTVDLYSAIVGDASEATLTVYGYTVYINRQFYNYYPGLEFACHIPFQVWHSTMIDRTQVIAQVVVGTSKGKVTYTYRLTVNQEEVNPLCEEHVFVFDLDHLEDPVATCCSKDPEKHYLSSCIGNFRCTVCGYDTVRTRCAFDENVSPSIVEHYYNSQDVCAMPGCGHLKTKAGNIFLEVPDDGKWRPGTREYTVSLKWDPEDLDIPDLEWELIYDTIYENTAQDVVTLLRTEGNRCILRAEHSGSVLVAVSSKDQNFETACCVEVAESFTDEEAYYQALREAGEDAFTPVVEQMIRAELNRVFGAGHEDRINEIIGCVRNADPLYRNLYLWSFYDYVKDTDPDTVGSYHIYGRIQVDSGSSVDTWFHESGHAVDWSLNQESMTESDEYREELYLRAYNEVGAVVLEEVLQAARDTDLSQQEKIEVADYIMGHVYSIKVWNYKNKQEVQMKGEGDKEYSSAQTDVFNNAVKSINQRITANSPDNSNNSDRQGDLSSYMPTDIFAGCTNEMTGKGHGPLTHEKMSGELRKLYTTDYWFNNDGTPTYIVNAEMWAEYFSSQLTGHNLDTNTSFFSNACDLMDDMAEELLEGYMQKHNP